MTTTTQIQLAVSVATEAHWNQEDKTGHPYIFHPLRVGMKLYFKYPLQQDLIVAGFLHDVLEDTDVSYKELQELFGGRVADLVQFVSKPKGMDYSFYINQLIKTNDQDVIKLKYFDMRDNIERLRFIKEEQTQKRLIKKYMLNFSKLSKVIHGSHEEEKI